MTIEKKYARITASFLFGAALIGLIVSILGIALVFPMRAAAEKITGSFLEASHTTLTTTASVLEAVNRTIGNVDNSIVLLSESTQNAAESLQSTADIAGNVATFVGDSLNNTLTETRTSLETAEKTAAAVDTTLAFITSIPYIGARYNPDKGLAQSIAKINDSLTPMANNLDKLTADLHSTSQDLGGMRSGLTGISENLTEMSESVKEIHQSTLAYQRDVQRTLEQIEFAQKHYKTWLIILTILAIIFFLWAAAAQIGLMLQARALWKSGSLNIEQNKKDPTGLDADPLDPDLT